MVKVSRLGFGLSSIAGSGNFAHQERLIRTAIDHGITHFDVAPYYGSGDAEGILGKILAKCSEEVTVTTKFGLLPFGGGRGGNVLRTVLRPVFRHARFLKQLATSVARQSHQPAIATFSKGSLLTSVEESIRKIGRPLDILLLHDPSLEAACDENLLAELEQVKHAGHVKATGVSGSAEVVAASLAAHPDVYAVAQLENSLCCPAPMGSLTQQASRVITHRAIQGGLEKLLFLLEKHPSFKVVWQRETNLALAGRAPAAELLLRLALAENAAGSVLFSSVNPDRVKSTATVLALPPLDAGTTALIRSLFREVNTPD